MRGLRYKWLSPFRLAFPTLTRDPESLFAHSLRSRTCVPMLYLFAHAHYSDARDLNTLTHISSSGLRPTLPGPVDPAHSTCILRAARPCSSAVHYFAQTRPPDMYIASPDMLVNSY